MEMELRILKVVKRFDDYVLAIVGDTESKQRFIASINNGDLEVMRQRKSFNSTVFFKVVTKEHSDGEAHYYQRAKVFIKGGENDGEN